MARERSGRTDTPAPPGPRNEFITRRISGPDDPVDIELSIRLSNGHFETSMSAPLKDKEAARIAFESWMGAIDSILPRIPSRASEEK